MIKFKKNAKLHDVAEDKKPDDGIVLITGVSGGLGRVLARRLHRRHTVHGIDVRPMRGKPKDVTVHVIDYRKKKVADLFRAGEIKALLHLGAVFAPHESQKTAHDYNLAGTARLLELCEQYDVKKVAILSSSTVYGALPENDQYLTENSPLLGGMRLPQIRALVEMDMLAQTFFWKRPNINTTILRPAQIVGPTVNNAATFYMRLKRVPMMMGFDPLIQLVHEEDVAAAFELCLEKEARGVFNIAGETAVPVSEIVKLLGAPTIPVPHPIAQLGLNVFYRLGLSRFPATEIDYVRFVCLVDDSRARKELGYAPSRSARETILSAVMYE